MSDLPTVKIGMLEKEHEFLLPLLEETFKEHNIPLQIRSFYDSAYDGMFVGQKGLASLWVFESNKQEAEQLLADLLAKYEGESGQ